MLPWQWSLSYWTFSATRDIICDLDSVGELWCGTSCCGCNPSRVDWGKQFSASLVHHNSFLQQIPYLELFYSWMKELTTPWLIRTLVHCPILYVSLKEKNLIITTAEPIVHGSCSVYNKESTHIIVKVFLGKNKSLGCGKLCIPFF